MAVHGSKSELKRMRYPNNRAKCISTLLESITFDSTIGFSIYLVFQKLDIQIFPEILRSAQSKSGKTFKYASKAGPEKAETADVNNDGRRTLYGRRKLKCQFSAINASRPLILPKKKKDFGLFSRQIFSLFSLISLPNTSKHFLFSFFLHNQKVVVLHPIFLSLVPYLEFEVQGCGCNFLATIHTLFFLQLFLV